MTIKTSTLFIALSGYVSLLPANIAGHRLTSVPNLTAEPINHNGTRDAGRAVHSNYPGTCMDTLETDPRLVRNILDQTKLGESPLHLTVIVLIGVVIHYNAFPQGGRVDRLTLYPPNKDRPLVLKIGPSHLPSLSESPEQSYWGTVGWPPP